MAAQIVYAIFGAAGAGKLPPDWRQMRVDYSERWHKREQAEQVAKTASVASLKQQASILMADAIKAGKAKTKRKGR